MAASVEMERNNAGFSNSKGWGLNGSMRQDGEEEEALMWEALEKLPIHIRSRTSILKDGNENSWAGLTDLTKLGLQQRHAIIKNVLHHDDNEQFLLKVQDRLNKVGIHLPAIELRFENLKVDAQVRSMAVQAAPTLWNFVTGTLESVLDMLGFLPSEKMDVKILNEISGIVKPSRMTLLLGPPASGKTTFLLALAGMLDRNLKAGGNVSYNGQGIAEFVPQRRAAYISQYDLHIGEMTVRETLDFSARCQGVGSRHEILLELLRREEDARIKGDDPDIDAFIKASAIQSNNILVDYVLKILGLDGCGDTLVGDGMLRGISGGQLKRVTTGEMLVGPARALLLDEISTGLDSSTTFQIVKRLTEFVHVLAGTMVVSLLQPAPETFELFDDIILLSEGHIVYQGPRELILDFFESQGFKCPERKGVADFLQEVTARKDQKQYWVVQEQPYRYVSSKELSEAFKRSFVGGEIASELTKPFHTTRGYPAMLVTPKDSSSNWELFTTCLSREWLLMKRNSFLYLFKTMQISVMATITMTVFLREKKHQLTVMDGNKYMGALFYGLLSVMFIGFSEMTLTIRRLPIFYKQRDLMFYPAWAYGLSCIITKLPLSFLDVGIWVLLTYWGVGFAPEVGRFFRQFLLLLSVHQMSLGLFRFMGALGRTMVIANTFGSFALLAMSLLGGFLVSRGDIYSWLTWGYWSSPFMYGQNAISVNEFLAETWQKKASMNATYTLGEVILKSRGIPQDANWFWFGVGAETGFAILFNIGFVLALTYLDPIEKPEPALVKDEYEESTGHRAVLVEEVLRATEIKVHGTEMDFHTKVSEMEAIKATFKGGMVMPFQPLSVAFEHINYYVDMPSEMRQQNLLGDKLQLLQDCSGALRPGILTALVGVSGAGKTTLMDVLAGRKTGGYIQGNITISGYPKRQETFARVSGYCEQNNVHSPNVSVKESLTFSAWLRLPNEIDKQTRKMFVDEVMELVELTQWQHSLVGVAGVSGLSTEQMKRLTIAVELVANPSIIFMDEPTSGLDARAAAIVMRIVRNTVNTGRTVLCTIHQPSIDIFEAFDELLLMKHGGQLIYAGELGRHSCKLIEYFQAVPGVPRIKDGTNPATWVLEATSPGIESQLGVEFGHVYRDSSLYRYNENLVRELSTPALGLEDLHFPTTFSQSFLMQCMACLWKQHRSYWRNPLYCVVRFFYTTIMALIFGVIFWDLGSKRSSHEDVFNLAGALYNAILFIGQNNASTVLPVLDTERRVYYRERAAGMYSQLPYAISQVLIEVPYVFVQSLVFVVILYSMVHFEWSAPKFLWFLFFFYFCFWYFTIYGMMILAISPSEQFAAVISYFFYTSWNLFSGFLIPYPKIPMWWRWYYWVNPVAWTLYGLLGSQLGDVETKIELPEESPMPMKQFMRDYFGYHHDFVGVMAILHIAFVAVSVFVFGSCIKYLNFQKR